MATGSAGAAPRRGMDAEVCEAGTADFGEKPAGAGGMLDDEFAWGRVRRLPKKG